MTLLRSSIGLPQGKSGGTVFPVIVLWVTPLLWATRQQEVAIHSLSSQTCPDPSERIARDTTVNRKGGGLFTSGVNC